MNIPYETAITVMNKLIDFYKKKGINLIPVGSLVRRQKYVNDIDFITNDKKLGQLHHRSTLLHNGDHINYDIWYIPKKYSKLAQFVRSYPKYYIIAIRIGLHKKGLTLTDKQLINNETGKEVSYTNFKELVDFSGVKYYSLSHYYEV